MTPKSSRPLLMLILICGVGTAIGCSMLSKSSQSARNDTQFQSTVAPTVIAQAAPIEVATDVAQLAQENLQPPVGPQNQPTDEGKVPLVPLDGKIRNPASTEAAKGDSGPGGKTIYYSVRRGDTLMKIAFEKYGNLFRWREIFDSNKEKIRSFSSLSVGTELVLRGVKYIVIDRNGTPYLIKKNDTLAKIASKVYEVPNQWRKIWKNNPQLIRDPNKIYTGFTLYYEPAESTSNRGPAAKAKQQEAK